MVNYEAPIYSLGLLQALVKQGHFRVVNRRANDNLQDLGWDSALLTDFILALTENHFLKRYPSCLYGNRQIDCDGYKMKFDEIKRVEDKHSELELFVKFAISNFSHTLIVSFHLEGALG